MNNLYEVFITSHDTKNAFDFAVVISPCCKMDIYVLRCKYLFIQISIVDVNPSLDFACIASIWKYCVGNLLSLQSYFILESLFAYYRKTSSISRTKSQSLNVSCILLQVSSLNPLKPGVKLIMKMYLEQRRQAMLQLHLSYQLFYCVLRCYLYERFYGIWYGIYQWCESDWQLIITVRYEVLCWQI